MFTRKIKQSHMGYARTKRGEPNLINKLYKHRTLGELIALSKQTGIPPMPTRNGVYTGEQPIPRERFDRENELREMNSNLSQLEQKYEEAKSAENKVSEERKSAELREQLKKELLAEQNKP